jgi:hypothetical protein
LTLRRSDQVAIRLARQGGEGVLSCRRRLHFRSHPAVATVLTGTNNRRTWSRTAAVLAPALTPEEILNCGFWCDDVTPPDGQSGSRSLQRAQVQTGDVGVIEGFTDAVVSSVERFQPQLGI